MLSLLFHDEHSKVAISHGRSDGAHLLSSLAWAETHAVISRIEREGVAAKPIVEAARETLASGPWRHLNAVPDKNLTSSLAQRCPLRGADLWHLALAKTMLAELPALTFLSFDARLSAAAQSAGLTSL